MACVAALFAETIIQGTSDHLHTPCSPFNEVYFKWKAKAATVQREVWSGVLFFFFKKSLCLCLDRCRWLDDCS